MNQYTKGQILIDKDGNKRKVLEVLGDLVFLSGSDGYEIGGATYHYKEIDKIYTVEQEKWKPEIDEAVWFVFIGHDNNIDWYYWNNTEGQQNRLALNLVFKTKEEALARYNEIINLIK